MALHFPGFTSPAVGFEVPLEMLAACHQRIEQQLASLLRIHAHLVCNGADGEVGAAAGAVLRYFDTAAAHHHEDEEVDLFPALIESMAGSDAVCLRGLTSQLTAEHRVLESHWHSLRPALESLAQGRAVRLDTPTVDAFVDQYRRHIAHEEAELLPMANRLLSDAELDRIGAAMRKRRGISLPAGSEPTPLT